SPIGELVVVTRGGVVCAIAFGRRYDGLERGLERRFARIDWSDAPADGAATTALGRYFDGDVRALEPLAADPGGSPFQRAVWDVLRRIPPGETRSYLDVARRVGKPDAVRAVARANATNPVPLIIPCHRVIGADGSLTGFGGGLDRKRWLLRHEAAGVEFALR
ncbi:MAG TPA: methylated-DNA--[protein]-cysteine S-methyltransferase, partial [Candidatus Polarisedimenticolaceae bacterium]|nr:methylated-DNA--[protein]-cysteine S-methyltransferase [Candidatus Polarisedimenticolaceae bacterium]